MKNILLCTDASAFAEKVYKYGAWFAIQFHAHINVLFVTDIRSQQVASTGNLSGSIGLGATGKVRNRLEKLGIAGLIPGHYWMSDRLNALKEGLDLVQSKATL